MSKKRLTLGDDGIFRDVAGNPFAKLLTMTVEVLDSTGSLEGLVGQGEQQALELSTSDAGGRAGASNSADREVAVPSITAAAAEQNEKIAKVWSAYVLAMRPRKTDLDPQGRKVIVEALKVASVDECVRAIQACAASDFHMGKNDRHRKYNSLSQVLKGKQGKRTTREQIDFFLDLAEKSGVQSGVPSEDLARVSAARRDVRDAHDFPNDALVQDAGRKAAAFLASMDITFDPTTQSFSDQADES